MTLSVHFSGLPLLIALAAWLPGQALAEGAVKLLECNVVRDCDASGQCEEAGSGKVRFTMDPVRLEAGGSGDYTISYGSTEASMQAMSEIGPFVWTVGTERDVLIASSETEWLWHRLELSAAPVAAVSFLVCSLQQ